jgi:ribosomal protein RSM22 (predicted rRNA methylase)
MMHLLRHCRHTYSSSSTPYIVRTMSRNYTTKKSKIRTTNKAQQQQQDNESASTTTTTTTTTLKPKFSTFKPIDNTPTTTTTIEKWKVGGEIFEKSEKIMSKLRDRAVVPDQEETMDEWIKRITANDPSIEDLMTPDEREEYKRINYPEMKKNWRVYFQRMDRYQALTQMSVTEEELYSKYHADDIQFLHYPEKERYLEMLLDLKNMRRKYREVGKRVKGVFGQRKLALVPITEEEKIRDEKFDAKFLNDHANYIPKAYWDRYYEEPEDENSAEWQQWKQKMLTEHGIDIEKEELERKRKIEQDIDEVDEEEDVEALADEETYIKKRAEHRFVKEDFEERSGIVPQGYYNIQDNPIFQKLMSEVPYESEVSEEDLARILTPEERELLKQEYLKQQQQEELNRPEDLESILGETNFNPGPFEDEIEDVDQIEPIDPDPYRTVRMEELEEREREELKKKKEFSLEYPHFMRGDVMDLPEVLQSRISQLVNTIPRQLLRSRMEMLSTRYRLAMLNPGDELAEEGGLKTAQDKYIKQLKSSLDNNTLTARNKYHKGSRRNQATQHTDIVLTEHDCLAYLPAFFPGHYCSITHILMELRYRKPDFWPKRWMDFGSGPGVGLWAMLNVFRDRNELSNTGATHPSYKEFMESLQELTSDKTIEDSEFLSDSQGIIVEPNTEMSNLLELLLGKCSNTDTYVAFPQRNLQFLRFLTSPIGTQNPSEKLDLIVAGWSLGEIEKKGDRPFFNAVNNLLDSLAENGIAIIVESGSPIGFRTISRIRSYITESMPNASILMPCGHSMRCPLYDPALLNKYSKTLDPSVFKQRINTEINTSALSWCHFAQRFNRLPVVRYGQRKHAVGTEKYSYIVLQKNSHRVDTSKFSVARLVDDPIKRGEHVHADICSPKGKVERVVLTKGKTGKFAYRYARKMRWGDVWWFDTSKAPRSTGGSLKKKKMSSTVTKKIQ